MSYIFIDNIICIGAMHSFIVDLRHKVIVSNIKIMPVFVQSSELSNRM